MRSNTCRAIVASSAPRSLPYRKRGQWIGSWTPWHGFVKLPANAAYRLPPGAHIAAEIHYRHTHVRVVDRGRIGLFFSDDSSAKSVSDVVVTARPAIDATRGLGSARRLHGESTVATDTALLALRPDLVAGLTSVEVAAHRADGGADVLLFAKRRPSGVAQRPTSSKIPSSFAAAPDCR